MCQHTPIDSICMYTIFVQRQILFSGKFQLFFIQFIQKVTFDLTPPRISFLDSYHICIFSFKYEDFELVNYDPWPHIAGKVSV